MSRFVILAMLFILSANTNATEYQTNPVEAVQLVYRTAANDILRDASVTDPAKVQQCTDDLIMRTNFARVSSQLHLDIANAYTILPNVRKMFRERCLK